VLHVSHIFPAGAACLTHLPCLCCMSHASSLPVLHVSHIFPASAACLTHLPCRCCMSHTSSLPVLHVSHIFPAGAACLTHLPCRCCMSHPSSLPVLHVSHILSSLFQSPGLYWAKSTNYEVPNFLHPAVTSWLLGPSIFLSTVLSQPSSLKVRVVVKIGELPSTCMCKLFGGASFNTTFFHHITEVFT
jgi:hypothetical protein